MSSSFSPSFMRIGQKLWIFTNGQYFNVCVLFLDFISFGLSRFLSRCKLLAKCTFLRILFIMSRNRTNLGTGQKLDTSVPDQIPDYRGNLGEHLLNKRGLRTLGREGWGQKDRFLAAGCLLPLPQRSRSAHQGSHRWRFLTTKEMRRSRGNLCKGRLLSMRIDMGSSCNRCGHHLHQSDVYIPARGNLTAGMLYKAE